MEIGAIKFSCSYCLREYDFILQDEHGKDICQKCLDFKNTKEATEDFWNTQNYWDDD